VPDGTASDDRQDGDGGRWRAYERVDEQYREPADPDFGVEPEIPAAPDPSENDVSPGLLRRFWALVAVFNVALLATALGLMIAVFDGKLALGGQLFLAGLVAFGFGLYRYRTARDRLEEHNG
jgi:hypothetical protein